MGKYPKLKQWGDSKLIELSKFFGLTEDVLKDNLQEPLKLIWSLQKLMLSCVAPFVVIYRQYGEPFDLKYCRNRDYDDTYEEDIANLNNNNIYDITEDDTENIRKEKYSAKYNVTCTTFPGFSIDYDTCVSCQVAIHDNESFESI
jgi:hypothetical protein